MNDLKNLLTDIFQSWLGRTVLVKAKEGDYRARIEKISILSTRILIKTDHPIATKISFEFPENYVGPRPEIKGIGYIIGREENGTNRAFIAENGQVILED